MPNLKLIEAKTLTSAAASITFSAIPQTYTDLKILVSARDDRSGQPNTDLSLQVGYNGTINTGSIYTNKQLYGSGSTVGSQSSSTTYAYLGMSNGPTSTANTFGNTEIYIPNYTSANNKSVSTDGVSENNATTAYAVLNANLISTSNPITDIKISAVYGSGNFESGSTFYLYGISNVTTGSKATGGIISFDSSYYYHMFPHSGTFTPTQSLTADYLVIGGGGGGGRNYAGGGGAGGYRTSIGGSALSLTAQAYTVTVGAGGNGGSVSVNNGTKGGDSSFSTITSTGGGGGIGGDGVYSGVEDGGSGGGTSGFGTTSDIGLGNTPSTSPSQGNNGGYSGTNGASPNYGGGGGGGATSVGGNGNGSRLGGDGGNGSNTASAWASATQTGLSGYYAAGGGGGGGGASGSGAGGLGGIGGGGNGGAGNGSSGTNALANLGSGGGGGGYGNGAGGAGGSGLVIIRYAI